MTGNLALNPDGLPNRQKKVIVLTAEGLTEREIAKRLGISYNTVSAHKKMASYLLSGRYKLDLGGVNRVWLTRYAVAMGWVPVAWPAEAKATVDEALRQER